MKGGREFVQCCVRSSGHMGRLKGRNLRRETCYWREGGSFCPMLCEIILKDTNTNNSSVPLPRTYCLQGSTTQICHSCKIPSKCSLRKQSMLHRTGQDSLLHNPFHSLYQAAQQQWQKSGGGVFDRSKHSCGFVCIPEATSNEHHS